MQYQHRDSYKIYSRPRLNLRGLKKSPKSHKLRKKIRRTTPIFTILIIAIITCFFIWNFINPVFENLCEDKAKSAATLVTNEETTKIIKKYNYDTFFTIEKDEKGSIQMINANILKINQVSSDIAINIQKRLDIEQKNDIYIPTGAIIGIKYGPKIHLRISSSGNIETDLKSEFTSQGVNQTLHRVYLNIRTNVNILTSFKAIERTIENQVLIAENIIIGEIPSTYAEKGTVLFSK